MWRLSSFACLIRREYANDVGISTEMEKLAEIFVPASTFIWFSLITLLLTWDYMSSLYKSNIDCRE